MVTSVSMMAQRKSPEELQAKAAENAQKAMQIHADKMAKSNTNFKNARVTSGSAVLMQNGKHVCVAFKGAQKPVDIRANRSSERTSVT